MVAVERFAGIVMSGQSLGVGNRWRIQGEGTRAPDLAGRIRQDFWLRPGSCSAAVGLFSLRYVLPKVPLPALWPSFTTDRARLVLHAGAASAALLLGLGQILYTIARPNPAMHRMIGQTYLAALLAAAVAAIPLALHAAGGAVSTFGFLALAAVRLITAAVGILRILRRRGDAHRVWMTRCPAPTAAAVTLRGLLAGSRMIHLPFHVAYPAIAWLCWVPNLCIVEPWLRKSAAGLGQSNYEIGSQ